MILALLGMPAGAALGGLLGWNTVAAAIGAEIVALVFGVISWRFRTGKAAVLIAGWRAALRFALRAVGPGTQRGCLGDRLLALSLSGRAASSVAKPTDGTRVGWLPQGAVELVAVRRRLGNGEPPPNESWWRPHGSPYMGPTIKGKERCTFNRR